MLQQMLTNILRQVEEAFLPGWNEGPNWREANADTGRATADILEQFNPLWVEMYDAAAAITRDEILADSVITASNSEISVPYACSIVVTPGGTHGIGQDDLAFHSCVMKGVATPTDVRAAHIYFEPELSSESTQGALFALLDQFPKELGAILAAARLEVDPSVVCEALDNATGMEMPEMLLLHKANAGPGDDSFSLTYSATQRSDIEAAAIAFMTISIIYRLLHLYGSDHTLAGQTLLAIYRNAGPMGQ